jgi:hypothetical protein
MARFLQNKQLYEIILQKSSEVKDTLLVCSASIGFGAHTVFSQQILKNPPVDMRFIFPVNDFAIKQGEVNPYEMQYLIERFKGASIRSSDSLHLNIYIFDNSALMTSATLNKAAFESNTEAGVLFEGAEADEIKGFFNGSLWDSAKPIGDLKKYKLIWNLAKKKVKKSNLRKVKHNIEIKDWTNTGFDTWYIGAPKWLPSKFERKIKKETNWPANLSLIGDVGYKAFLQLKLGDNAYIADINKRGKIGVDLVRIIDKAHVETDEGDYHAAFEKEKSFTLERGLFYEMLKKANVNSKSSETILNDEQLNQIALTLSSIKRRRKSKS